MLNHTQVKGGLQRLLRKLGHVYTRCPPEVNNTFSPQSFFTLFALYLYQGAHNYKCAYFDKMSEQKASSSTPSNRKDYKAKRDASRVALFDSFARWRAFKAKHDLKSQCE